MPRCTCLTDVGFEGNTVIDPDCPQHRKRKIPEETHVDQKIASRRRGYQDRRRITDCLDCPFDDLTGEWVQ